MNVYTLSEKVTSFAILSRIVLLILQVVSNHLFPDHEADAFISPTDPGMTITIADKTIDFLLGGLKRWDAQYFIHIAQYGYSHENTLAFFPLYPMTLRILGTFIHAIFQFMLNYHSCLILGAVIFNLILFVKTASVFFNLSKLVLRSEIMAYKAALLFCINPASIFFTAPYSEVMFSFLTFYALLLHERSRTTFVTVPLSLASAARSNGIINIIFLGYRKLQDSALYFHKLRNAKTDSGSLNIVLVLILTFNYPLIPLVFNIFLVFLPFMLFQLWSYMVYCREEGSPVSLPPHLELYIRSNFLHSPDLGEAEWCYSYPPLAYSHIQEKYWEVGFLRYYEFKQLPNFLLALPVVMTIICHAALYMVDNSQVCWNLGIPPIGLNTNSASKSAWLKNGIDSWRVFIYTMHSLSLCIFCVLCINVQVTTRLLCSSSPVAYWFAAHLLSETSPSHSPGSPSSPVSASVASQDSTKAETELNLRRRFSFSIFSEFPKSFWGQVIISYYILYFVLGTALFSNFLPWT